jgi:hypothetical protein
MIQVNTHPEKALNSSKIAPRLDMCEKWRKIDFFESYWKIFNSSMFIREYPQITNHDWVKNVCIM